MKHRVCCLKKEEQTSRLTILTSLRLLLSCCCVSIGYPPYLFSWIGWLALSGWVSFFFDWSRIVSPITAIYSGWIWSFFVHLFWLRGLCFLEIKHFKGWLLWLGASFFYSFQFGIFLIVILSLRKKSSGWTVASFWILIEGSRLLLFDGLPFASIGLSIASSTFLRQLVCLGGPLFLSHWCVWFSWSFAHFLLKRSCSLSLALVLFTLVLAPFFSFPCSDGLPMHLSIANSHFNSNTCHHSIEEIWSDWILLFDKHEERSLVFFPENILSHNFDFPICIERGDSLFFYSQGELLQKLSKEYLCSILIGFSERTICGIIPNSYLFSNNRCVGIFKKKYLVPGYERPYFKQCQKKNVVENQRRTFLFEQSRAGVIFCLESMLPWPYEECFVEGVDLFLVLSNYIFFRKNPCLFAYQIHLSQLYAQAFGRPSAYATNCGISGLSNAKGDSILFCHSPSDSRCHACHFLKVSIILDQRKTIFSFFKTKGVFAVLFASFLFSNSSFKSVWINFIRNELKKACIILH